MSKVNTILNNLKHFPVDNENSICFGELSVNIEDLDTFQIPGNIKSDSHIILTNSQSDIILKNVLSDAPVISDYSVTIYDYLSTVTNKYLKDRVNNNPGSVNNRLSKIKLLSQIKLPDVSKNEDIYLVLDSYETLNMVSLDDSKITLLKKEMSTFKNNNTTSSENVNLFITKEIYDNITKFVNDEFELNFKKIWVCKGCCLSSLVEYLMGKIINCSDKSHQGHIELSGDLDILSVLISSNSTDSMIGRNNSILQFNTFNGSSNFNFIVILKNSKELTNINFNIDGKCIGTSELLKKEDTQISFEYIKDFLDNYNFCNLLKSLNSEERKDLIIKNSDKVIKYFMMNLENKEMYPNDKLELIHLSNVNNLKIIKSLLINECNNYDSMIQVRLPFHNSNTFSTNHIPLERHNSVAD
jgi:hypothetical protein